MLASHATLIPLAPGDWVTLDGDVVTGVEVLERIFTVEVAFHVPADLPAFTRPTEEHRSMRAVAQTLAEWERTGAHVTRTTNFTALVSSSDPWLAGQIPGHQFVEYAELIRQPGMAFDFDVAIQHPDISGTNEGPWA